VAVTTSAVLQSATSNQSITTGDNMTVEVTAAGTSAKNLTVTIVIEHTIT
jgi:hypothetical protein